MHPIEISHSLIHLLSDPQDWIAMRQTSKLSNHLKKLPLLSEMFDLARPDNKNKGTAIREMLDHSSTQDRLLALPRQIYQCPSPHKEKSSMACHSLSRRVF